MLTGLRRVSKADGSQSLDFQRAAVAAAGVDADGILRTPSGAMDERPGLEA